MIKRYEGEKNNNPVNWFTGLRIGATVVEASRYVATNKVRHYFLAGVAHGCDGIDGWWARRRGETTTLGSDLDKTGDKISAAAEIVAGLATGNLDYPVLAAVGAVNISNMAAVAYSGLRGNLLEEANQTGRFNQLPMNLGLGFNVIGNHWRKNGKSPEIRLAGQALRYVAGAVAVGSAIRYGIPSTIDYWRQAAAPQLPEPVDMAASDTMVLPAIEPPSQA